MDTAASEIRMGPDNPGGEVSGRPPWQAWSRRWGLAVLFLLAAAGLTPAADGGFSAVGSDRLFRVGMSAGMFSEVNEGDAKAALTQWGRILARQIEVDVEVEAGIIKDTAQLKTLLRERAIDAAGMTIEEYFTVSREFAFDTILAARNSDRIEEQLLLLVHQESRIAAPGDLKGLSLVFWENMRACLGPVWLDLLLAEKGLRPAPEVLGSVASSPKLSGAVLPVFFRKADACVVTRTGFETMVELNPQIGSKLKTLAVSTGIVPAVFCLRADYKPPAKAKLVEGFLRMHTTPAGRQLLNIFRGDQTQRITTAELKSAGDMLGEHARVIGSLSARKMPPAKENPK